MRKIIICAITAILLANLTAVYATPDTPKRLTDVDVCFESGLGIQMLITNNNDVAIYNVSMSKDITISRGHAIMSTIWSYETIPEIEAGGSDTLNKPCFGFPGYYIVTATIIYETQGQIFKQDVQGHFIMLGFLTIVI